MLILLGHITYKTFSRLRDHLIKEAFPDPSLPDGTQQPSVVTPIQLLCNYILICPSSYQAGMPLPCSQLAFHYPAQCPAYPVFGKMNG